MYEIYFVTQVTRMEWQEQNARYNRPDAEGAVVHIPNALDRAASALRRAFAALADRGGALLRPAVHPHVTAKQH